MNVFLKYGSVLSCVFMLAACETPGASDEANGTGTGVGQDGSNVATDSMNESFTTNAGDRVFFRLSVKIHGMIRAIAQR